MWRLLSCEGLIKRFLTANQPATFAVGKSLYDTIPPRPIRHQENHDTSDDLFSDVCPECGFTTEVDKIPKKGHNNKYGRNCPNKMLQRVSLGHQFSTDILKINLPDHLIEQPMSGSLENKDQYLSVLYALLEGTSAALDINRSDIRGCVTGKCQIVLYDDTPGGSGFVKHVYENLEMVIAKAKEKVNGNCGCTEETSCYGCLRNYGN